MALFRDTITLSYTRDTAASSSPGVPSAAAGTALFSVTVSVTADGSFGFDNTIADATTDGEIDLAFALSKIKMLCILSEAAMTLKTNSTGSPGDTLSLAANVPVAYYSGAPAQQFVNPFTVDVTKLYVTNASGSAARLRIRLLLDTTPVLPATP